MGRDSPAGELNDTTRPIGSIRKKEIGGRKIRNECKMPRVPRGREREAKGEWDV